MSILSGLSEAALTGVSQLKEQISALVVHLNLAMETNKDLNKQLNHQKMWENMHKNEGA